MSQSDVPPTVSIVGRKNSGKTTFLVTLAAELKRRGLRVASVKHGHHGFEIDQPGTDSWRHFNEGGVDAVLLVASDKLALVMRQESEPDPAALIERFYSGRGYDLVLVEGYKHGPFPKIEIYRTAAHDRPVYDAGDAEAAAVYLAIVTDDPSLVASCPVISLDTSGPAGSHVAAIADLLQDHLHAGRPGAE